MLTCAASAAIVCLQVRSKNGRPVAQLVDCSSASEWVGFNDFLSGNMLNGQPQG